MAIRLYRIYCVTDSKLERVWAKDPISTCPVNAAHEVDIASLSVEAEQSSFKGIHRTSRCPKGHLLREGSVDPATFVESDWIVYPDLSGVASVAEYYWKAAGDVVVEMDAAEKTTADAMQLDIAKGNKTAAIDARTREIISEGFIYDCAEFSLSVQAQQNIVGLKVPIDMGWITFPHKVSTMDDNVEYELADATAYYNWYAAATTAIKTPYDSGRALKVQVMACTTVAEVDAIEDTR